MIHVWVLLDNEPPVTQVSIGRSVSLTCLWVAMSPSIPMELQAKIPSVKVTEDPTGVVFLTSDKSADFVVVSEGHRTLAAVSVEGIAVEDPYMWMHTDPPPVFDGVVEDVRYLWSPEPSGAVTEVSLSADSPGHFYGVGRAIRVAVS